MFLERFSFLHKSRRLHVVFLAIIIMNIALYGLPILVFIGPETLQGISFLDLGTYWLVLALYLLIAIMGSLSYLKGDKKGSLYWFDVLLIVMISKLIATLYRMLNLIVFFRDNPYDQLSTVFGPYIIALIGLITVTIILRYYYPGIERRNSIFYYR
jgi:hypothetical protein